MNTSEITSNNNSNVEIYDMQINDTSEPKQNTIRFEEGILGFEDIKDYLLYQEQSCDTIWNLQAQASEIPSFVVIDPFAIFNNYYPILSSADYDYFGKTDAQDLLFLVISVIKANPEESVANLKAPIVIDIETKRAKQIILENSDYPVRCKLFKS